MCVKQHCYTELEVNLVICKTDKKMSQSGLQVKSQDACSLFHRLVISYRFNPLRPSSDLSQTSHCNIKGLSVSEVMRIENMITQVKFY